MTSLIILAPGFEEIEALTIVDVARRAGLDITICSLDNDELVTGSHNITIKSEISFDEAVNQEWNCLILPGGMQGVENMLKHAALLEYIKSHAKEGKKIAAICAAPLVLDACNLLMGKIYTAHPGVVDQIIEGRRIDAPTVSSGPILTGRSAGAAMAWSLAFVNFMLGSLPEGLREGLLV